MPESDDLRQLIRDIAARHERIWREQAEMFREMRAESRELIAGLREVREESWAQTRALLQVLDRLENGRAKA